MKHVLDIMTAYSDCNGFKGERDLKFFCPTALTGAELQTIFPELTPEGYNAFDPKESVAQVIRAFGDDSEFYIAREGSVCIYIKPKSGNVWMDRMNIDADEIMFDCAKQMFRVWWD